MENRFDFTTKYKIIPVILIVVGLVATIAALFIYHDHGARVWSNFLLNTIYFLIISLGGMVFLAIHTLGTAGWQTSIQRIPEAMMTFLPVTAIFMFIILIGMWFNLHHLYSWAHLDHPDELISEKQGYLNIPFFTIRTLVYLGGWIFLSRWYRQKSLDLDNDPDLKHFHKSTMISGIFIVFFAVTSSTSAWDWLMSIDPRWYSTLYGWYVFAGLLDSSIATIILIVLLLRVTGHLPHVNKEHMHDLGMYLFAFSVLWGYLWFSQYMLQWYGNLPDETVYFHERLRTSFRPFFFINLCVNFGFPFLVLMARNAKRINWILVVAAVGVIIGHWIDFYLLIMPGTLGAKSSGIGFLEVGMTLGFVGLFLFVVFRSLAKAPLIPVNHPYLKESYDYHTQY